VSAVDRRKGAERTGDSAQDYGGRWRVLTNVAMGNTASAMPTLTLKLPTGTAARLERMAARRRTTKSAVMREALEDKLRSSDDEPSVHDLMKAAAGSIDSGVRDLGHNPGHLRGFGRK
jgi:predicted transcriptional regulator